MSTVQVTWTDNGGGATFSLERSITSAYAGFSVISAAAVSPYNDLSLADDQYWYRVRGLIGTAYTDYSNVATVTTTT